MLFAHLKRILKLDRLRLRGPNGARDEFHLAAAAQNLRKLAKLHPDTHPQTGVRALGLRSTAIAKQPTAAAARRLLQQHRREAGILSRPLDPYWGMESRSLTLPIRGS